MRSVHRMLLDPHVEARRLLLLPSALATAACRAASPATPPRPRVSVPTLHDEAGDDRTVGRHSHASATSPPLFPVGRLAPFLGRLATGAAQRATPAACSHGSHGPHRSVGRLVR
eukprot:scaffold56_cov379-Prasinococcus_capsulatus_cf.AAC.9